MEETRTLGARWQKVSDQIWRQRLKLAGRDNYQEGFWHGVGVGMLKTIEIMESDEQKPKIRHSKRTGVG